MIVKRPAQIAGTKLSLGVPDPTLLGIGQDFSGRLRADDGDLRPVVEQRGHLALRDHAPANDDAMAAG